MAVQTEVHGIVLSTMPLEEADKRVVLLTREMGKISAFARGAKRMNSPLAAATRTFAFGKFTIYPGKNAYTLSSAEISEYFEELSKDVAGTAYGCYFLEYASLFARENVPEEETLVLLYYALKALILKKQDPALIRTIVELKILALNGLCPDFSHCGKCGKVLETGSFRPSLMLPVCSDCGSEDDRYKLSRSALYTLSFIREQQPGRLFSFTVSDTVLRECRETVSVLVRHVSDRELQSEKLLDVLTG